MRLKTFGRLQVYSENHNPLTYVCYTRPLGLYQSSQSSEYSRNLYARRARFEFGPPLGPGATSPASIASAARVSEALWVEHSRAVAAGKGILWRAIECIAWRSAQTRDRRRDARRCTRRSWYETLSVLTTYMFTLKTFSKQHAAL